MPTRMEWAWNRSTFFDLEPNDEGSWGACLYGAWELPANNCVVYSAGYSGNFNFEFAIAKARGCEIHTLEINMQGAFFLSAI